MIKAYNHKNCQSLFGYAQGVHERSGGICQLCGCGQGPAVDFDLWRQMTVEYLIGSSQGGYFGQIKTMLMVRFPDLEAERLAKLAFMLDEANTVTACSFCNSTTSRVRNPKSMQDLMNEVEGSPEEMVQVIIGHLERILEKKREDVAWKLRSIRVAFDLQVEPNLLATRSQQE